MVGYKLFQYDTQAGNSQKYIFKVCTTLPPWLHSSDLTYMNPSL